jgi:hypothetical protein
MKTVKKVTLNISAEGTTPYQTVKRQLGSLNQGLYCTVCSEFFSLSVIEKGKEQIAEIVELKSDGKPLYECPFCHAQQRRDVSEIGYVQLTERNKKRPPPPRSAH